MDIEFLKPSKEFENTYDHILFDLTYNPKKTKFITNGKINGAKTINGYNMLIYQAEKSWSIWNEIN